MTLGNKWPAATLTFREGTNDIDVWKEQKRAYKGLIYRNSIVLDIGCHAGYFCSQAIALGANSVVGFEPHPDNYIRATNHLKGLPCVIYNQAVTSTTGIVNLYSSNSGLSTSTHSLYIQGGRTAMEVQAISFQDALSLDDFTVVKIDIEGGEYVLDMNLLPDSVTMIAMELHLNKKQWRMHSAPNMIKTLEMLGFKAIKKPWIGEKNWTTTGVWTRNR